MPHRLINRTLGFVLSGLFCGGLLCGGLIYSGLLEGLTVQSAEPSVILPPNFEMQTVVSGLQYPTDMVLLPSGEILVAEKGTGIETEGIAHVRLIRRGVLVSQPVVSVSVTVVGDSGIYSIVLDPAFESNHYFYLWYSVGKQGIEWPGQSIDRLSRFTFDPQTGKADALSETIILDGIRWSQWHNGGGLAFDAAGNLLIATGDAANNSLAQNVNSLNGKLLRIRPRIEGGYVVPTENVGEFASHANGANRVQADMHPEIYALGLRNPFRMAWNPADQAFYLIDLGFNTWEEVDRVEAGANYGWAVREGPCPYDVRGPECEPAPEMYTEPVFAYPHPSEGGAGISALGFYAGTAWPELYQGQLFFADFNTRTLSMVDLDTPETVVLFGEQVGNLVDIEPTDEGLYVLSFYEGVIRFIYYSQAGNQRPVAQIGASPMQGAAPLAVNFSAVGSSDPEGDALTYRWDFADGTQPITTTEQTIQHIYNMDGDYPVTLQVMDAVGNKSELLGTVVQVYSGAMPTVVREIVNDPTRARYRGGDQVRFVVERVGGKEGLAPLTPYVWSVKQHHNQHVHFIVTEYPGDEVVINIGADSHAAETAIWYEAELTMHTAGGQAVRVSNGLQPDVVSLTVRSLPSGASMRWNGAVQPSNRDILAIVGQTFTLEAPEFVYSGRTKNRFASWRIRNEAGTGSEEVITERSFALLVAKEAKSYIAHYDYLGPSQVLFLPSVLNIVADTAE